VILLVFLDWSTFISYACIFETKNIWRRVNSLCRGNVGQSWKARQGAYDELAKKFQQLETDAEFMKYVEFLKGMVVDTNQAAQESGVAALVSFVAHAPANTSYVYRVSYRTMILILG
jgi:hypothetical protein